MSTFKHFIIPLERDGKNSNDNLVYWPPTIVKAWDHVFGRLTPPEAEYFIRFVSTQGIYFNVLRLNKLRREAVILQNEDLQRDHGTGLSKHELAKHLISVNMTADPEVERVNIEFSEHHIHPRSRGGLNDRDNLAFWMVEFHAAYHTLFANLRLSEVIECTRKMTKPYPKAPYKMSHSFLDYLRQDSKELIVLKRHFKNKLRFTAEPAANPEKK